MRAFNDLRSRDWEMKSATRKAVFEVLESGVLIGGTSVERFEDDFAAFTGAKFCVGVGNGLDALRLALEAIGVGPGDEVLVPAQTFIATWLAVKQLGARPVPVDVQATTGNIDPTKISEAVTPRTQAIVVVHLHGRPADMYQVAGTARRHGLALVEDAAQAHGARYNDQRIGGLGDVAAFSFYPTKNLGAVGDAGCVTTSDPEIANKVRSLRSYGARTTSKYHHDIPGWNSRLDPIQAAVLSVYLPKLDEWNARRRSIAADYLGVLNETRDLSALDPDIDPEISVWHHFVVSSPNRDAVTERLTRAGVPTEIHYPLTPMESGAFLEDSMSLDTIRERFPVACWQARNTFSLPICPFSPTTAEVARQRLADFN